MSAAVTVLVHDSLLKLLLLRILESPQLFPLVMRLSGVPLPFEWNSVLWCDLSQRECAGALLTRAVDRCALCRSEVRMQIDREEGRAAASLFAQSVCVEGHDVGMQRRWSTPQDLLYLQRAICRSTKVSHFWWFGFCCWRMRRRLEFTTCDGCCEGDQVAMRLW